MMTIYDIDLPGGVAQARKAINYHFTKNGFVRDERVIGLLLAKGYMELEETLMQWKQKTHLLRILEPMELAVAVGPPKNMVKVDGMDFELTEDGTLKSDITMDELLKKLKQ